MPNPVPSPLLQLYAVPIKVVRVAVDGNERTKDDVIQRSTRTVWSAQTFGQLTQELSAAQGRLQQLDIFESAQILISKNSEEVVLTVEVKEKNCTTLKTGTYVNADNAEGNMEGLYVLRNYFGTAERFELSSAVGTSSSNNFKLDCCKPAISASDIEFRGQLNRASMHFPHSSYHDCETKVLSCYTLHAMWRCLLTLCGFWVGLCVRRLSTDAVADTRNSWA